MNYRHRYQPRLFNNGMWVGWWWNNPFSDGFQEWDSLEEVIHQIENLAKKNPEIEAPVRIWDNQDNKYVPLVFVGELSYKIAE